MIRLLELSIQNFRGFGPQHEPIKFDADLTLIFGPNGYGKTSLAEAIEWLFYDATKRRQRGESYSRSEYAGCYTNIHGGSPTQVEALVDIDGREVRLARRLAFNDSSITLVDGIEAAFSSLGIFAAEAMYPVVAQHGLQSFVHSKPKDRRDAICAAFGLDELTALKSSLDSSRTSFQRSPPSSVMTARRELGTLVTDLAQIAVLTPLTSRWRQNPMLVSATDLSELLQAAAELARQDCATSELALAALREVRQQASRSVFNAELLKPTEAATSHFQEFENKAAASANALVEMERRISAVAASMAATYSALILEFWKTGLELVPEGLHCPMCEEETLNELRRTELRRRLSAGATVTASNKALAKAAQLAKVANDELRAACFDLGVAGVGETEKARLRELFATLPDQVNQLLAKHDAFIEARVTLSAYQSTVDMFIDDCSARMKVPADVPMVVAEIAGLRDRLADAARKLIAPLLDYMELWLSFRDRLAERIASTDFVSRVDAVGKAIKRREQVDLLLRYNSSLLETQTLIRKVEAEIRSRQTSLLTTRGDEVNDYYKRLTSDADVGFEAMEPGTDNIKLHATSFGRRMSAAANLSECQLNCLGLSVSLMRANTPSSPFGFILLDDPVQSMDDVHNEAFVADIVPHLLDDHSKQVIILSHTQGLTDRIRDLNPGRQIRSYHIENYERSGPTVVEQIRLKMLLADVKVAAKSNERNRKYAVDRIRVITEHFIRELHLLKLGLPAPAAYNRSSASELLPLFRLIPDTTLQEHAALKDTCDFSSPAHHTQVGYTVPVRANIDPHINRLEQLMKKHGLI